MVRKATKSYVSIVPSDQPSEVVHPPAGARNFERVGDRKPDTPTPQLTPDLGVVIALIHSQRRRSLLGYTSKTRNPHSVRHV